ncbi:MAG: ABC transporter permease subunit, partial [Actinomycetota bacterium]
MTDWLIYRTFWDLTVTGVALGAIYALVALGYTLVYGVLRLINFAHSEIFMVGTFATLITATNFIGIPLLEEGNYPYRTGFTLVAILLACIVGGMVVSGAGAVLLERVAYRPLRGSGEPVGAVVLAFATAFTASLIFTETTRTNVIIGLIGTAPLAVLYLRIFRRGRQAP